MTRYLAIDVETNLLPLTDRFPREAAETLFRDRGTELPLAARETWRKSHGIERFQKVGLVVLAMLLAAAALFVWERRLRPGC